LITNTIGWKSKTYSSGPKALHTWGIAMHLLNASNEDIIAASIFAEKALPQFGEQAWSVALATARRHVYMLSKLYSDMRRNLPLEDTLRQSRYTMP
jgi:hypothetical protein